MVPDLMRQDRWRLLTARNIQLKKLWPWGHSIQRILAPKELGPAPVKELIVASDFGGEHKSSSHLIYAYLVVATGLEDWARRMAWLRRETLGERTMAYKSLGDGVRQAALGPFLSAASDLDAHLVVIAVDKRKKWLSTQPGVAEDFRQALQLQCFWNPRALEAMMRKAHFVALQLSVWAPSGAHVTWLTDQDEFVANERRHDDALQTAGHLSAMYLDQPMGIFALNTTAQDSKKRHFEDLCSVADLAAGLWSDVRSGLPGEADWPLGDRRLPDRDLTQKAAILFNWFADRNMRLRKTLITIDDVGTQFLVRELQNEIGPDLAEGRRDGSEES